MLLYHDIGFFEPVLREAGIPIHVLPRRAKLDPGFLWALRRWLLAENPDVVHAFQLFPAVWGALVHRTLPRRQRPVFVAAERSTLHRTVVNEIAQRIVYRSADAVTANAACVAEEIVRRLGVRSERVHVLPNGIDLSDWDARSEGRPPIAREPEGLHLALVGGLRQEKNHVLLLEAALLLSPPVRSTIRIWFVGGETGGGAHAAFVRSEVDRRGLGGIVRFVPETTEVPALLRTMDALVLPSQFEGFPNAVLEAMASRLPVIATAVGEAPQLVGDGVTGFLVPPGNASALARAIERLHGLGSEGRSAMGQAGRSCAESRYRLDDVAARYLALYDSLLSRSRAG